MLRTGSDDQWVLQEAVALHQTGRLAEAATAYRRLLATTPDHAEATSLLGLVLVQADRAGEALSALRKAVDLRPEQAAFRLNLARGPMLLGITADAELEARTVLDRHPGNARALELLGDLAASRQDLAAAAQSWRASLNVGFSLPPVLKFV